MVLKVYLIIITNHNQNYHQLYILARLLSPKSSLVNIITITININININVLFLTIIICLRPPRQSQSSPTSSPSSLSSSPFFYGLPPKADQEVCRHSPHRHQGEPSTPWRRIFNAPNTSRTQSSIKYQT